VCDPLKARQAATKAEQDTKAGNIVIIASYSESMKNIIGLIFACSEAIFAVSVQLRKAAGVK
jgi:hypothetical protein